MYINTQRIYYRFSFDWISFVALLTVSVWYKFENTKGVTHTLGRTDNTMAKRKEKQIMVHKAVVIKLKIK